VLLERSKVHERALCLERWQVVADALDCAGNPAFDFGLHSLQKLTDFIGQRSEVLFVCGKRHGVELLSKRAGGTAHAREDLIFASPEVVKRILS
jgi:hypothetical protein